MMSCKTLCMHICIIKGPCCHKAARPQERRFSSRRHMSLLTHLAEVGNPTSDFQSNLLFFYLRISDLEMYKPSCKGSQVHAYRFFLQQVSLTMTGCLRRDSVLILLSFNILVFEVSYICEKPLGRIKSVLI